MFCVVTWDVGDACKNKDDSCRSWRISKRFKDSQASLSSDPIFSMAENLEELWDSDFFLKLLVGFSVDTQTRFFLETAGEIFPSTLRLDFF